MQGEGLNVLRTSSCHLRFPRKESSPGTTADRCLVTRLPLGGCPGKFQKRSPSQALPWAGLYLSTGDMLLRDQEPPPSPGDTPSGSGCPHGQAAVPAARRVSQPWGHFRACWLAVLLPPSPGPPGPSRSGHWTPTRTWKASEFLLEALLLAHPQPIRTLRGCVCWNWNWKELDEENRAASPQDPRPPGPGPREGTV